MKNPRTNETVNESEKMSAYSNQGSNNRSPRGGRRRPRRAGNSSNSTRSADSTRSGDRRPQQQQQKQKKKSLWQKIVSFFKGKPEPVKRTAPAATLERKPAAAPRASAPATVRKPESIEVTSPRVYVGNLSFDAGESDLQELFSGVGSVQTVEIVFNKHTHRSKGFGFVQMQSVEEATRAVSELHDKEYMGRKLVVSGAKAVQESRSNRSQSTSDTASDDEGGDSEERPSSAA